MDKFVYILKAVSDPTRIRILMALKAGELCACRITEMLKLAPSTVSKHMSILKIAGFIEFRKDGRWIYYKLSENRPADGLHEKLLAILDEEIAGIDIIEQDSVKVDAFRSMECCDE